MDNLTLTIGQYLKGDSWIYKLDPRFKIISIIVLMIALFLLPNIECLLVALGLVVLILLTSKIPILYVLKGLKPILFLSMFSFVLQIVYSQEGTLLYAFNLSLSLAHILIFLGLILIYMFTNKFIPFKLIYLLLVIILGFSSMLFNIDFIPIKTFDFNIYSQGLLNGAFFVTRIILIVSITTLLTLTTSTIELNSGLERVLKPFKIIGVPTAEIALMVSLTLRFVPTLLQETNKILKAQASRGVDFTEGGLIQKIKQIVTLLIPMFVVSFKRADELACAMESRGYVIGSSRTSLNVLKFRVGDYIGFILIFSLLASSIVLKVIL